MDLLRQQLAPITDAAWDEINEEAKNALALKLSARRIVDVTGPLGLETAAVNLGRLDVPDDQEGGVRYGVRRVQPLVELRCDFELDLWELDSVDRGSKDADLDDLHRAVREMSTFEERAVYEGFDDGSIQGLTASSEFEPVSVDTQPDALPEAVERAILRLRYADVGGPYALALGAALYGLLDSGCDNGYPVRARIERQVDGGIVLAPYLHGGVLVSRRGGDTEMVLGQDTSIGYHSHDSTTVRLYLTESFTFRVITPEAVVAFEAEAST